MNDLNAWLKNRPSWVQEAASLLLTKGRLTEDDITGFVEKCLQESDSEGTATDFSLPSSALQSQTAAPLRLSSISNVKGINALAPRSPLDFGLNHMTVIYGGNGSGKSGYVRILKHVCGARKPGILHPNVYASDPNSQSAEIKYKLGDEEKHVTWNTSGGIHADLRPVDIFDADCGRMYLEDESEVTYEPPALLFFPELISVCEQVAKRIDGMLGTHVAQIPQLPPAYTDSTGGKWYEGMNAQTPTDEVISYTKWDLEDETAIAELEKRLAEKSPADRARELRAKKQQIDTLIRGIEEFLPKLSDENCGRILALKKEKNVKSQTALAAAQKVFAGAPLEGIGSDAWKLLWEHARRYSEEHAYQRQAFPHLATDARCVLCQQPLSEDAQQRLLSFEEFIKGQAEREAKDAEKAFDQAIADIGEVPDVQATKSQCDACRLAYEGDMPPIAVSYETIQQRKTKLLEIESVDELPKIPDCTTWLQSAKEQASGYVEMAKKCEKDAKSDTRPKLEIKLRELKARKWLSEQRTAIEAEIKRLKTVKRLEQAKRLTDTRGLSRKKGEIAEELITETFVNRFRNELVELGAARIKVELVKRRVDHGRVLHELRLKNARSGSPQEVLSEGEHRVVSLAAFLADVTGKQQPAPFVFDDPISSLDQDFEEAVVQRLVRLSADRQVIVFTHRISLLVLLKEYGKRERREPKVTCVRCESWGTGEPGDTPLFAKKPDKALNALLNERLTRARKVYEEKGQSTYSPLAKSICSDFRIILERMIEFELLADVVQRFRRKVTTEGKLSKLARVTSDDCKFFDDMMTKYSRYEHSQPDEAPVVHPTPDELNTDIESLSSWRTKFNGRVS